MGRSAKLMKRPTKAEKQSRQVNQPSRPRPARSLSPEIPSTRSEIPLFNTSVPGRPGAPPKQASTAKSRLQAKLADYDPMSLDSSTRSSPHAMEADDLESNAIPSASSAATTTKKTAKERLLAAKESVALDQHRSNNKLQGRPKSKGADRFSLGVDYVGLHEKRNGGKFAKKL
ncbi:hypothetical protein BCR35DRAFT_303643, partial [Leucosporidium creatinivorum]